MPLSLKSQLKKFVHKGQITQEEYNALIKKLDGHDREVRNKAIDEFAEEISLKISESLIWGFLPVNCREGVSDEITDYVLDTVREIAEQLKGE